MAEAVELAALAGTAAVDAALGTAALAAGSGDGDLLSITGYQAGKAAAGPVTVADEAHSAPARHRGLGRVRRHCRGDRAVTGRDDAAGLAGLADMLAEADEFLRTPAGIAALTGFFRDRGSVSPPVRCRHPHR